MSSIPKTISESELRTDLSEMAHSLIRELAGACKKMAIYGPDHPQARKAVEKPFMIMQRIFGFKKFVNINLQKGELYLLNIRLKETIFNGQIIQYMQYRDVNAMLFERSLTADQFASFIQQFVRRVDPNDRSERLSSFLEEDNLDTIQVNSETAFDLFEKQKQYRGDVEGDFSVKRFCLDQLPDSVRQLAEAASADEQRLLKLHIDFDPAVVDYVVPEKVADIPYRNIRSDLMEQAEEYKKTSSESGKNRLLHHLIAMMSLVENHRDREKIVGQLDDVIRARLQEGSESDDSSSVTGQIRIESQNRIEQLIEDLFAPQGNKQMVLDIADAFARLLKTGQKDKAEEICRTLTERLSDPDPLVRQKALNALLLAIDRFSPITDLAVIKAMVQLINDKVASCCETFEYSELIWRLFDSCRRNRLYKLMADVVTSMAARRSVENGVTVYDSMAVKKAFENINQPDAVKDLVGVLTEADFETSSLIRDTLIAIGSEEIAFALSEIISHENRQVRQQSLRILAELGKASLRVFSRILMDDSWFEREPGRHELPDATWYVLRNSIFVLGSLRDEEAVASLRLRMTDNDVRIRREIIAALEKIGGEEAVDLLILMAEDPVAEIRERAIIVVGLIGPPETAPMLIDVARRNPADSIRLVNALGQLGGMEARDFFTALLTDDGQLTELAGGKVARDDLRLAVVKALGKIGDDESIEAIREFHGRLSTTQRIFFKNSPVLKTVTEILEKK